MVCSPVWSVSAAAACTPAPSPPLLAHRCRRLRRKLLPLPSPASLRSCAHRFEAVLALIYPDLETLCLKDQDLVSEAQQENGARNNVSTSKKHRTSCTKQHKRQIHTCGQRDSRPGGAVQDVHGIGGG
ncbi:hypothetical protein ACS0TY_030707 [Phlomoides rotata]